MSDKLNVRQTIRMSYRLYEAIENEAIRRNVNSSVIIREILSKSLLQEEDNATEKESGPRC